MSESVAQDQIKSYVDRILRMKEEAKAINADIREIYAEAKGNGFDKTVLGKLVNYVEKRNADSNAVAEGEALFELYLTAYYGVGTKVATHTHEAVLEPQSLPPAARDLTDPLPPRQVAPIQPETATRRVDDLGSVQDARKMSTDGQPAEGLGNSDSRTPGEEKAGVTGGESAATLSFAERIKKLRPLCQSPNACRSGGGKNHCHSCLKASQANSIAGAG